MKIHQYNQMMKHLTRQDQETEAQKLAEDIKREKARKELKLPKDTKLTGSKMLNWINYNNKMFGDNKQPITEDEKKVAKAVDEYGNPPSATDRIQDPKFFQNILKNLHKKPVKIVKKTKPIKPLKPLDPLLNYDWRLAPWWDFPEDDDSPPPEDKTEVKTGITKLI